MKRGIITMKYHKIRGIDISVCTAEQKIAYNLVSAHYDCVLNGNFHAWPEASHFLVKLYTQGYDYKPGKYDIDAIFCAINAGIESFCKKPFIATSYDQIGKAFPAHYLNA